MDIPIDKVNAAVHNCKLQERRLVGPTHLKTKVQEPSQPGRISISCFAQRYQTLCLFVPKDKLDAV